MKVLRIKNTSQLDKIIFKNGNNMLVPVNDGAGNLIVGTEVLNDPAFAEIKDELLKVTEEIDYIPFPHTFELVQAKIQELELKGDLIRYDSKTKEVSYKNAKIGIKEANNIKEEIKLK